MNCAELTYFLQDNADNTIAQWPASGREEDRPPGGLFVGEKNISEHVNTGSWKFVVTQKVLKIKS